MRKVLISLAAATATLAVAAPASAQAYGNLAPVAPPYGYGYAAPAYGAPAYGAPGYGAPAYGYGYGQARALQTRLDNVQRQLANLARYRMITRNEYENRLRDSREVERNLHRNIRDGRGLTQRELYNAERQLANLEQRIGRDVRDGRHWGYRW